jgi:hypothetical protein
VTRRCKIVPGFDERLTRELRRAARPPAPDVVKTFADISRRRARHTTVHKIQVLAAVVAILAATAGTILLLDDRYEARRPMSPNPLGLADPRATDVGLATALCDVETLRGLDMGGRGTPSVVWTGYAADSEGTCRHAGDEFVVAVDATGDGAADASWSNLSAVWTPCALRQGKGTEGGREGLRCSPFGGADLDANGDDELVVGFRVKHPGLVTGHMYFDLHQAPDGRFELVEIPLAGTADPAHGAPENAAFWTTAGSEVSLVNEPHGFRERDSSWMRCEGYPEAPVLVWTQAWAKVGSSDPIHWRETKYRMLGDGMFHVVSRSDLELPQGQEPDLPLSTEPACGIDFYV